MPPGLIDPGKFHASLQRGLTKKLMSVEYYQLFFFFFEVFKKNKNFLSLVLGPGSRKKKGKLTSSWLSSVQ